MSVDGWMDAGKKNKTWQLFLVPGFWENALQNCRSRQIDSGFSDPTCCMAATFENVFPVTVSSISQLSAAAA
jgi:hypothetical protein